MPRTSHSMNQIYQLTVGIALVAGAVGCFAPDEEAEKGVVGNGKEEQAVAAARVWLEAVDAGDYAESWEASAALFRKAVAKKQWVQQLVSARKPLGGLVSRELASKHYATELPGAPDGEYVVIRFATSFENKKTAVETITPMLDTGGAWRVSGYFIK